MLTAAATLFTHVYCTLPLTTAAAVVAALTGAGYYCGRLREGNHTNTATTAASTLITTDFLCMIERSTLIVCSSTGVTINLQYLVAYDDTQTLELLSSLHLTC
jgi:hypothetical protein